MKEHIKLLCQDIETSIGRSVKTPKDFDFLRKKIYERLHVLVSTSTLKRIWGYFHDNVSPRESSLSILAQSIGYKDWKDFVDKRNALESPTSSPVLSNRINVRNDLQRGDTVKLLWAPDRECVVKYLGESKFIVLKSKNTRLMPGNSFECCMIIENEPMYIDNLIQNNNSPAAYICGKISGIKFVVEKNC